MRSRQVYDFNVPTFGKGVVFDVDQKIRVEQFRMFTEALKKDRLKSYVPQFDMEAQVTAACTHGSKWVAMHASTPPHPSAARPAALHASQYVRTKSLPHTNHQ